MPPALGAYSRAQRVAAKQATSYPRRGDRIPAFAFRWSSFFCLSRSLLRGNPCFPGLALRAMFLSASGAVPAGRNFSETADSYPKRVLLLCSYCAHHRFPHTT